MPRLHEGLESVARLTAAMGMDIPEQFAKFGREWARLDARAYELDALARALEDSKSAVLAKKCRVLDGDFSIAAAEREVKSTQEWHDFLGEIKEAYRSAGDARRQANAAKVEMDYFAMKMNAWLTAQVRAREAEAA